MEGLTCLVPVPGCLLGSKPATCPRTPPAGRKFTPASTSETGRKSSAGPETPPLELLLPVGPLTSRQSASSLGLLGFKLRNLEQATDTLRLRCRNRSSQHGANTRMPTTNLEAIRLRHIEKTLVLASTQGPGAKTVSTPETTSFKPSATSAREEAETTQRLRDPCCVHRLLGTLEDATAPTDCWEEKGFKTFKLFFF